MHQGWRHLSAIGALCGVALALGGCSAAKQRGAGGKTHDAAPASSSQTGASVSTSPTSSKSERPYGFETAPTPPPITDRGSNYTAIAASLLQYDDWLGAFDPDPSLIQRIAARGSTFDTAVRHDLAILQRLNRRYYELQSGPAVINVLQAKDDAVTLRYIQRIIVQRVVDRSGKVTSEQKFSAPTTSYTVVLARVSDGRWLVADVEPVAHT
jgi:hypothetical protein